MIFADKLIRLRRRKGLSQEELADKLDVTRQAVSRWEGNQTYPDLSKIVLISKIFEVSTDYLLKDEIEEESVSADKKNEAGEKQDVRMLTQEETQVYLKNCRISAIFYALATAIFIVGPVIGYSVLYASSVFRIPIRFQDAIIICISVILISWIVSAVTFVLFSRRKAKYSSFLNAVFEFEYGTEIFLKKEKRKDEKVCLSFKITGICMIVIALILIVLGLFSLMTAGNGNMFDYMISAVSMAVCAVGALVGQTSLKKSYERLCQKGKYEKELLTKQKAVVLSVFYWLVTAVIFAGAIGLRKDWIFSWVYLIFAALLYFSVLIVQIGFRSSSKKK